MTTTPTAPVYEPIHLVTVERKEFKRLSDMAALGMTARERHYERLTIGHRQHFSVPNNWIGKLFLWALRRWLNHTSYKLTLKGRNVRRPPCTDPLPMSNAKRIGIYIDQKKRATRRVRHQ